METVVLSARSATGATPLADDVRIVSGNVVDLDAPRLIVLIHGYQNSVAKAQKSYARFRDALASARWPIAASGFGQFCEFHWPGNHPNSAVSMATYSSRIGDARESGAMLADFLAENTQAQEVCLVAHSLGCRVALETVRTVARNRGYAGPRISHVFLLAAAVPWPVCVDGERLRRDPRGSAQHVFHSTKDGALKPKAFGTGQYFYGEGGEAVGRRGRPDGRWTSASDTGLGHGEYWGSYAVADAIGALMGPWTGPNLVDGARRLPAGHSVDTWDLTEVWDEVDAWQVTEHSVAGRIG